MPAEKKKLPPQQKALIIAGPTCSGKSALAMALAKSLNGIVINADAMQSYRDLRILTARPSLEDEQYAPHALYGILEGSERGSVGGWLSKALEKLQFCQEKAILPIFCGGTGMYLNALLQGIADIPPVNAEARQEAEDLWQKEGEGMHRLLFEKDPQTAQKLKAQDQQRICRAWSVWRGTGKPLSHWISKTRGKGAACDFSFFHFAPDRVFLRQRLERRFEKMLAAGALEETSAFLERNLDPSLPLMRAHGVPEIKRYQDGAISLDQAASLAVSAMRSYAKRQDTWFRHHPLGKEAAGMVLRHPVTQTPQADEMTVSEAEFLALHFLEKRGFEKK